MKRPLCVPQELAHVVQIQARPQCSEIACRDPERHSGLRGAGAIESQAQEIVDELREGLSRPARLRLQPGGEVVIEGDRRSHDLILIPEAL